MFIWVPSFILDEAQRTLSGQVSPNRLGRQHGKTSGLVKLSSKNRVVWARKNDYGRWNRESYVKKLLAGVEYARNVLSFRLAFTLAARGDYKKGEIALHTVDGQLVQDWNNLLSDDTEAKLFGKLVDKFGLLAEPFHIKTDFNISRCKTLVLEP